MTNVTGRIIATTWLLLGGYVASFAQVGGGVPLDVLPADHTVMTDSTTGAKITYITTKTPSSNLYFHERSWLPDSSMALFLGQRGLMGYLTETGERVVLSTSAGGVGSATAAAKRNAVYCMRGNDVLELALTIHISPDPTSTPSSVTTTERRITTLTSAGQLNVNHDDQYLSVGLGREARTIQVIGVDDGSVREICKVEPPLVSGYHLQWSRTASNLLSFAGGRDRHAEGEPDRIWVVDPDEGVPRNVYRQTRGELVTHESWWVNDQILFCGAPPAFGAETDATSHELSHVKILDPATGIVRIVGAGNWWPETTPSELAKRNWWHCAGSEDGRWIVADNWHGDIVLFEGTTTRPRLLTTGHRTYGKGVHPHPGWDRKGERVVFTSHRLGNQTSACIATIPSQWQTENPAPRPVAFTSVDPTGQPRVVDKAAQRPNIVLIMSDDMGFSDIGCYGGEIQTPNLDALAASGVRFTQFYNAARCCPTRASLLTGLYPHQAGMGHMTSGQELPPAYVGNLSHDCATIAELLRPAGYRTYMAGKWHVTRHERIDSTDKGTWPRQRGFDRFYGTITGGGSFYDPTTLCRDNTLITPENDPEYQPERFYYTDAISDNAVQFLQAHGQGNNDAPFFLYVAFTAAHWPMHALPEDIAKYKGVYDGGYEPIRRQRLEKAQRLGLIDAHWKLSPQAEEWSRLARPITPGQSAPPPKNLSQNQKTPTPNPSPEDGGGGFRKATKAWETRCMEVYAAMVDRMDRGIGQIVSELRRQDQLEKTLIFFLQDNGGCAEGMGRRSNAQQVAKAAYTPFGPDDLQPKIWPPMQTRDGRPVRTGPGVMPGPADTYIAYGRGWANVSNTPFREYKHWVHEGGISTPLIVHWPAGIPAKRSNQLVTDPGHLIDIAATCADVARAPPLRERNGRPIAPVEGINLRPALIGKPLERPRPIFFEHEGNRAVRDGRWKLVAKGPAGKWELYDMENDRTEMNNLAAERPGRTLRMATKWESWAQRTHVIPWIWQPPYGK